MASELDVERRLQQLEEARARAEQRGDRELLCSAHESLALWALHVFDTERAARHLDDMEAVGRELGQERLAAVQLLRARLALIVGDDTRAMSLAHEAETRQRDMGAPAMLGQCLALRAGLLAKAGDPATARDLLQQATDIYIGLGDASETRACRLLLADAWRCEGRLDQALPLVEAELPSLDTVGALDSVQSPLAARMAGWRVLAACGDARAGGQIELAMAELERRVDRIGDPAVRRRVLDGLPLHREVAAEWHEHLGLAPKAIADRP